MNNFNYIRFDTLGSIGRWLEYSDKEKVIRFCKSEGLSKLNVVNIWVVKDVNFTTSAELDCIKVKVTDAPYYRSLLSKEVFCQIDRAYINVSEAVYVQSANKYINKEYDGEYVIEHSRGNIILKDDALPIWGMDNQFIHKDDVIQQDDGYEYGDYVHSWFPSCNGEYAICIYGRGVSSVFDNRTASRFYATSDEIKSHENMISRCRKCGCYYIKSETGDSVCYGCDQFGVLSYQHNRDLDFVKSDRDDANEKLFFGIELEAGDMGSDTDYINSKAIKIRKMMDKLVICKEDGSIEDGGFETITVPLTYKKIEDITPLIENWLDYMSEFSISGSETNTGMHIHVSRNAFTEEQIFRMNMIFEAFWDNVVRFSDREYDKIQQWCGRYCSDRYQSKMKKSYIKGEVEEKSRERYHAINLSNSTTVEFRIFNGTLNFEQFMANIEFVKRICDIVRTYSEEEFAKLTFEDIVYGDGSLENLSSYARGFNWVNYEISSRIEDYTAMANVDVPKLIEKVKTTIKQLADDPNQIKEICEGMTVMCSIYGDLKEYTVEQYNSGSLYFTNRRGADVSVDSIQYITSIEYIGEPVTLSEEGFNKEVECASRGYLKFNRETGLRTRAITGYAGYGLTPFNCVELMYLNLKHKCKRICVDTEEYLDGVFTPAEITYINNGGLDGVDKSVWDDE